MAEANKVGMTPVSTLTADEVVRIPPWTTLHDAARALADADVGMLVVGATDRDVRGVVSERDLVRAVATGRDLERTCVVEVANTRVSWCDASATVAEVAEEMMERYIRHILVEEDGRLLGVVSARDLLGVYAAADYYTDG